MSQIDRVIEGLRKAPTGLDDYIDYLEDLLDDVGEVDEPDKVFPQAFRFFEDHADADCGMPGPLVHFLEKFFPDYIDDLCASLARKSTGHTVWMLNRILNAGTPESVRQELLGVLLDVVKAPSTDEAVREQAQGFLTLQEG